MVDMEKLASFLLKQQEEKRMNESDMASFIGIGQSTYSRLINMRVRDPAPSTMRLIMKKFNVDMSIFLEGHEPPRPPSLSPDEQHLLQQYRKIKSGDARAARAIIIQLDTVWPELLKDDADIGHINNHH